MRTACLEDIEKISCSFYVYPVVPIRLGKVIKYEAKKTMPIVYLETVNIEKGQIDPKHNRRVKAKHDPAMRRRDVSFSHTHTHESSLTHTHTHMHVHKHTPHTD